MGCLIAPPPPPPPFNSSLSVVSPGSQARQKRITCRWTRSSVVWRMLFRSNLRCKQKALTQTHVRRSSVLRDKTLGIDGRHGDRWNTQIKQAQSASNPAQTKRWTSELRGSKLKVWLLVNGGYWKWQAENVSVLHTLQLLDFRFPRRASRTCTALSFLWVWEPNMEFYKAFINLFFLNLTETVWENVKQNTFFGGGGALSTELYTNK